MVHKIATPLPLEQARAIVAAARARGRELGLLPLTVVVLDIGGHLLAAEREDGSGILRYEIALAKAWGALGMGLSSATIGQRLGGNPGFLAGIIAASDGRMAPNPGGILLAGADGQVIGAVGISGDTGDNDEICARHGAMAAGLAVA